MKDANEILIIIPEVVEMNAIDVHALLLTCPSPVGALRDFGESVATGKIDGTATVIYNRDSQIYEGQNAKVRRYWRRIEAAAQQSALWTDATVDLPPAGTFDAVRLTSVEFDDEAVKTFVAGKKPAKPLRGRKRKQDEWTPFWIAAIKLGKVGMLNISEFETQADLVYRLHTMMGATLDEQTIKPLSAIIYKEVVRATIDALETEISDTD